MALARHPSADARGRAGSCPPFRHVGRPVARHAHHRPGDGTRNSGAVARSRSQQPPHDDPDRGPRRRRRRGAGRSLHAAAIRQRRLHSGNGATRRRHDSAASVSRRRDRLSPSYQGHEAATPRRRRAPGLDRTVSRCRHVPFAGGEFAEVKERLDSLARKLAENDGLAEVKDRLETLTQKLADDDGLAEVRQRLDNLTQQAGAGRRAHRDHRPPRQPDATARSDGAPQRGRRADLTGRAARPHASGRRGHLPARSPPRRNGGRQSLDQERDRGASQRGQSRGRRSRHGDASAACCRPRPTVARSGDGGNRRSPAGARRHSGRVHPSRTPTSAGGPRCRARSTQELAGLEQQLRQINEQIGSFNPAALDKVVDLLRDDLAEIGVMLQDAMPRRAIEALEAEMRKLSERIDQTREAGAAGVSLAGIESGLAEVRDALRMLTPAENLAGLGETVKVLTDKVDLIAANSHDPAALKQLEGAIVAMRGIVTHVASNDALTNLSAEVRALSAKVDQMSGPAGDPDVLANLEQRIAKLADALEARNRGGQDVPQELETVLSGLSVKLESLQSTRADEMALGHLEDRIGNLVQKLDASDQRLNHLEGIERGIADLVKHLEQQRLTPRASEPSPDVDTLDARRVGSQADGAPDPGFARGGARRARKRRRSPGDDRVRHPRPDRPGGQRRRRTEARPRAQPRAARAAERTGGSGRTGTGRGVPCGASGGRTRRPGVARGRTEIRASRRDVRHRRAGERAGYRKAAGAARQSDVAGVQSVRHRSTPPPRRCGPARRRPASAGRSIPICRRTIRSNRACRAAAIPDRRRSASPHPRRRSA